MGEFFKKLISFFLALLIIAGIFVAGYYYGPSIASKLWFLRKPHTAEQIPDSNPHTADEVVEVEVLESIDASGAGAIEISQQKVPYVVEVDFTPVLLEEAHLEKKLVIMTQKATASETAKKDELFSLAVFKQTKAIIFHGEGTFYVDLSSLSSSDFVIDNDKKTITIYIPKPQLTVRLLPEETEFFDSSNGTLRFGEFEISPEIMTTLQTQGIERIKEILDSDQSTWETVEKFAKLSVKEIYEPLVAARIEAALENANDEYAVPPSYTIIVEIKGK